MVYNTFINEIIPIFANRVNEGGGLSYEKFHYSNFVVSDAGICRLYCRIFPRTAFFRTGYPYLRFSANGAYISYPTDPNYTADSTYTAGPTYTAYSAYTDLRGTRDITVQ